MACRAGVAASASHAPGGYTLREWHEQDGLLSDELAGVVLDREGFLWVASNSALTRFDGTAFANMYAPFDLYTRGLIALDGMPAVPAVRSGETPASGHAVFREGSWRFESERQLGERAPRALFLAPDGALWLGCDDGTLLRRAGEQTAVFPPPEDLSGKKIPAFATDSSHQVWITRSNRLSRVAGTSFEDVALPSPEPELRIASSATGGVWLITRSRLLRWEGTAFEEVLRLPELAGAHFVQSMREDSHGSLWIGTRSQGLFRVADRRIEQVPTSSEDITSICEDTDGNLWIATNGGGLNRLRPRAHQLFDQTSGLKDNFSYTVAEDASGTMWLANRDGGMARVKDGVVDPVSRREKWRSFSTLSVFPDPNGWIWMTTGLGVYRTRADDPQSAHRLPSLAHMRNVRVSFVASNGDYWLAADPEGVVRWRDEQVVTLGAADGFDGREARAFAEDSSGRIWIGAADGRLFRSNGDRVERIAFPGSDDCGALQVLRFESDGSILLGTTRRGVVVFPGGDLARPRALDDSHGLPGSNISQILVDDHDRYWLASRIGIFWVHGSDLRDFAAGRTEHVHAVMLGKDEGVPYLSCLGLFQPAAWKARDGTLWFATRRGVLRIDPAAMASTRESPAPVSVTSIDCDGQSQPPGKVLRIQSTVRKIQIGLASLNLSAPESVQVRYRLDGFDGDWAVLDRDRIVTYPRLPPGRYVLSTMASNGSGSWNSQPAQITILVRPPWWQSRWAQGGYLLALIGAIIATVRRWSHRRLRLRLERAEHAQAIEQERARIARNIHDDVGASLTRISLLTQSAQQEGLGNSPTLEKIYDATHAITRSMDEIVWAVNPRHDNTESLVYYLGNFAQAFLGSAGIRCRLESPDHMPEVALTSQIRHHLFLCCKEALNNVVKHAHATEAVVRISVNGRSLVVAIADNGRGIMAGGRPDDDSRRGAAGNGLRNMRHRMIDIRGTCTTCSGPSGGTVVTFTAPIDNLQQAHDRNRSH